MKLLVFYISHIAGLRVGQYLFVTLNMRVLEYLGKSNSLEFLNETKMEMHKNYVKQGDGKKPSPSRYLLGNPKSPKSK